MHSDPDPLFRNIAVALALSPRAVHVLSEAKYLAERTSAGLTVIHVGKDRQETRKQLNEVLSEAGVESAQIVVRDGRPDEVVCAAAREAGADLILAGALEKESTLGYLVGSAARRIARHAGVSVLLLTEPRRKPAGFPNVVVALDYSEHADAMLRSALDVARVAETKTVHVVHEYEIAELHRTLEDDVDTREENEYKSALHAREESALHEYLYGFNTEGLHIRHVCLAGKKGYRVLEYARSHGSDLLITLAPRRRLTFWDKLFQSGVEYALEHLPCAYLLFHAEGGPSSEYDGRGLA